MENSKNRKINYSIQYVYTDYTNIRNVGIKM
jgi:hypothetical protein